MTFKHVASVSEKGGGEMELFFFQGFDRYSVIFLIHPNDTATFVLNPHLIQDQFN